jgi:hypothetical protein
MAETATQQAATKVPPIGVDQTTETARAWARDGVQVLGISGRDFRTRFEEAATASLSRLRYTHCPLFVSALVTFQKSRQSNAARGHWSRLVWLRSAKRTAGSDAFGRDG